MRGNPARSVGCIFDAIRNYSGGPGSRVWAGRPPKMAKPSPRKLEPHEVIAKLKARKPVSVT